MDTVHARNEFREPEYGFKYRWERTCMRVGPCCLPLACVAAVIALALVGGFAAALATQPGTEYHAVTSIVDLGNGTFSIGIRCKRLATMVLECGLSPPDLDSYAVRPCPPSTSSKKYGLYVVPCGGATAYTDALFADQGGKEDHDDLGVVISVSVVSPILFGVVVVCGCGCGFTFYWWLVECFCSGANEDLWDDREREARSKEVKKTTTKRASAPAEWSVESSSDSSDTDTSV